jgi:hypothetical protein
MGTPVAGHPGRTAVTPRPVRSAGLEISRQIPAEPCRKGTGWSGREIGTALRPGVRGRGIGRNVAEQQPLLKAGVKIGGVVRAAELRAGPWRRTGDDPAPRVNRVRPAPAR